MSSITSVQPRTLADVIPGGLARNVALVVGGAAFVGVTAQLAIPLPFTPVPLSLQTFSVLLTVAVLGSTRGLAAMALYALAGMAGMPWFSAHQSGWSFASFGYVIGFVVAALVVGKLAERGADRTPLRAVGLLVLGNLAIYAVGVPGLMLAADMSLPRALALGVVPFLLSLPSAWKLVNARRS
jgi:biotin transport system substrate-specific component